ncbi:hypothetical protein BCR35DRAFT_350219 [Leucosporidium creatinivorum]|uniref:Uncharacterized protein n=1 Tax=Leucosporidium creatinivorum TaxID=106004 RepID=A0A1Y2G1F6_9BASI|nr:hypothetical protein BCR35DRAFT_350219 [Leucosporidium creatinivorum]
MAASETTVEGSTYIHALASYIRQHESKLADFVRRAPAPTAPSWATILTLGIVASEVPLERKAPLILRFDPHHLYYLLLKFDEVGIPNIGSLDVRIEGGASRPMSVNYGSAHLPLPGGGMLGMPNSDTMSIRSGFSSFSMGSGWWGTSAPPPDESVDVKYLYSSCTKLPALRLSPFSFSSTPSSRNPVPTLQRAVQDFGDCPPPDTTVPLYAFKNLQSLILEDLDPRAFLGWDVLSVQLKSLEVHRSGIEDLGELVCDAVVEDLERRKKGSGGVGEERRRRQGTSIGLDSVHDHEHAPKGEEDSSSTNGDATETSSYPVPPRAAWSQLRHLSLAHNSLTFIPSPPLSYLSVLTSLDLSSNLLISVPVGLSHLHSLRSLNLSDNMIDTLVGVSKAVGAVTVINLSKNRLENLSGLDRLFALERIDVRENRLREALEVSRLATLPCLRQVWIESNPFSAPVAEGGEEGYRVKCFNYFAAEGRGEVTLDGTGPGMNERRGMETPRPTSNGKSRSTSMGGHSRSEEARTASEAKIVGRRVVTTPHPSRIRGQKQPERATSPSRLASPSTSPSAASALPPPPTITTPTKPKPRHRKPRRIVDLDGLPNTSPSSNAPSSIRTAGDGSATSGLSDSDIGSSSGRELSKGHGISRRPLEGLPAKKELSAAQEEAEDEETAGSSSPIRKHTRYPTSPAASTAALPPSIRRLEGSSSLGASSSPKKATRRERLSASTFEPPTSGHSSDEGAHSRIENSGEAFRKKIEALRNEVGESWLSVLGERELAAERSKSQSEEEGAARRKEEAESSKETITSTSAGEETSSAPAEGKQDEAVAAVKQVVKGKGKKKRKKKGGS